jgi:ABC-2 type transport system permease protein
MMFFTTLGWSLIAFGAMYFVTYRVDKVFGLSRAEILMITSVYGLIMGIMHTLFTANFERFSQLVNRGELYGILIKPVSAQFLVSVLRIHPLSLMRLCIGIAFILLLISQFSISITLTNVMLAIPLLFIGAYMLYCVWFICNMIVVWFHTVDNMMSFMIQASNIGRYPPEMLFATRNVWAFLLVPLTLFSAVPARVMMGTSTLTEIVILCVCALAFHAGSQFLWKRALRSYVSGGV